MDGNYRNNWINRTYWTDWNRTDRNNRTNRTYGSCGIHTDWNYRTYRTYWTIRILHWTYRMDGSFWNSEQYWTNRSSRSYRSNWFDRSNGYNWNNWSYWTDRS
jgi:hypothetical protein